MDSIDDTLDTQQLIQIRDELLYGVSSFAAVAEEGFGRSQSSHPASVRRHSFITFH